ncbi:hypothetical protein IQ07DRAFT_310675 [Pyrenochaeta sp. DS3sAY3a]|nr:hypothetical protein IQ07DRAFT_310675 [Pyrenochaeta sp. DS3sAY3a]
MSDLCLGLFVRPVHAASDRKQHVFLPKRYVIKNTSDAAQIVLRPKFEQTMSASRLSANRPVRNSISTTIADTPATERNLYVEDQLRCQHVYRTPGPCPRERKYERRCESCDVHRCTCGSGATVPRITVFAVAGQGARHGCKQETNDPSKEVADSWYTLCGVVSA